MSLLEAFSVSVFGYKLFNELYTVFITRFKGRRWFDTLTRIGSIALCGGAQILAT